MYFVFFKFSQRIVSHVETYNNKSNGLPMLIIGVEMMFNFISSFTISIVIGIIRLTTFFLYI
jgi:hypothetical protein